MKNTFTESEVRLVSPSISDGVATSHTPETKKTKKLAILQLVEMVEDYEPDLANKLQKVVVDYYLKGE